MANGKSQNDITPIGYHNFRGNSDQKFGVKADDRRRHIYVVGKTGVGKSTLLENMAIADIEAGRGIAFLDPHGESAEKLLDFVPEERLDDVIYFDPSDMEYPIAFNPMEQVGTEFRHLVASGIMGVFKKIWVDAWSARMEYILNNTLLALLELPNSTLLGVLRMFAEPPYRKKIVDNLQDPVIKAFWQNEFARYSQKLETEALAAIQNKVGQFVSNPLIRNILGQSRSTINMREIMDTGKIFIVNLSKGKMGEDNSALLGAMIISRLQLAAMSRVDIPEEKRRDFFMYVDEFQNFATDSFASILSEARKYHLSLTLAHQYIGQLVTNDGNTKVRDAVFGNVGTIITFRVGAADGEFLEKEFMPEFLQNDLVNLAKANIYIKLMIDGVSSKPFSATTLPPHIQPLQSYKDIIIKNTREHYAVPRAIVDERIAGEWNGQSDAIINEKLDRRGEKSLAQVLRPGGAGAPARSDDRPRDRYMPPSSARPPVSSSSPSSPSSPAPASSFSPLPRRAAPPVNPRPATAPIASSRSAASSTPASSSTPAATPAPSRPIAASRSTSTPITPTNSAMAPVEKTKEKEPLTSIAREIIAESSAPISIPESAPASGVASAHTSASTSESARAAAPGAASASSANPNPTSAPKQFVRPKVDIEALRRSITESLKKQSEDNSSPAPKSASPSAPASTSSTSAAAISASALAAERSSELAPTTPPKPTQINTEPPGRRSK